MTLTRADEAVRGDFVAPELPKSFKLETITVRGWFMRGVDVNDRDLL